MTRSTASLRLASFVVVLMAAASATPASAVVIDFEPLATPTGGEVVVGTSYTEDGFTISGNPLFTFAEDSAFYAGSASMIVASSSGEATLVESTSGDPFTLNSIDLSNAAANGTSDPIIFTGTLQAGGIVEQTFQPTTFGFETFVFGAAFTDLVSVSWLNGAGGVNVGHQFDNIVINMSTIVPEPATASLGLFAAAGLLMRRRRSA